MAKQKRNNPSVIGFKPGKLNAADLQAAADRELISKSDFCRRAVARAIAEALARGDAVLDTSNPQDTARYGEQVYL